MTNDDSIPSTDSEFRFQEIDAQTAEQHLKESGGIKLPLPEQDREEMQQRLLNKQTSRLTLWEAMIAMTIVCLLMGISNFVPFDIYTISLGVLVTLLLFGIFDSWMPQRYRNIAVAVLLSAYLISAGWLIVRNEGWLG